MQQYQTVAQQGRKRERWGLNRKPRVLVAGRSLGVGPARAGVPVGCRIELQAASSRAKKLIIAENERRPSETPSGEQLDVGRGWTARRRQPGEYNDSGKDHRREPGNRWRSAPTG